MAVVLVVDDEPLIAMMISELIEDYGHTPLKAFNGAAALTAAQSHRPSLIITDLMMPVMDGYTLIHALRTDPALARTPIYVMSAAFIDWARFDETTPNGFLHKPFDATAIEKLLQALPTGDERSIGGAP
jgi:CheY-like chemotaxis protein